NHYDEFHKVEVAPDGKFQVTSRRVALRHRLNIGTIVSDQLMIVKMLNGSRLGTIEEYFVSRLSPGDIFWYAGRNLELVRVKENAAQVRRSDKKAGAVPSWMGSRMPLSSQMSEMLRFKLNQAMMGGTKEIEMQTVMPLVEKQQELSHVPGKDEFLIEKMKTREGYHVFMYPFEGRNVHEGLAFLMAYRISLLQPITFSIALNDYGFELLSDQEIPIEDAIDTDILSPDHLFDDINASVNSTEMARRKFRDIASISGLIFKGYPGKFKKDRHIQSSSQLFFEVFHDYEPSNLLLRQAFDEVLEFQLEETRMRKALVRISKQKIILTEPRQFTPFSFPLMVDRLRERMSTEKLEDRIRKMKLKLEV
ncbi:MAG: DNA ligase-associated DEXH box helicase, partial [Salibacteraceae bacterium]